MGRIVELFVLERIDVFDRIPMSLPEVELPVKFAVLFEALVVELFVSLDC